MEEKVSSKKEFDSQAIKEINPKKRKRNKKYILLYIAGFAFLIYASFTIINQSIEINNKRTELKKLNDQIEIIEINVNRLKEVNNKTGDDRSDYIEDIAREDLDFVKNGERVFINISGD